MVFLDPVVLQLDVDITTNFRMRYIKGAFIAVAWLFVANSLTTVS